MIIVFSCLVVPMLVSGFDIGDIVFDKYWEVKVSGQLKCGDDPYKGSGVVALWEEDTLKDDFITSVKSNDSDGKFHLSGSDNETGRIKPYIMIYHRCHYENTPTNCYLTARYNIPAEFVGDTKDSNKKYDMGIISLSEPSTTDGSGGICAKDVDNSDVLKPLKEGHDKDK